MRYASAFTTGLMIVLTLVFASAPAAAGPRLSSSGRAQDPAFEDGVVLVGFKPGTSAEVERRIEVAVRGQDVEEIGVATHVLRVTKGHVQEKVAKLRNYSAVRYAEPNYIVSANAIPNDPSFGQLWGLRNTGQTLLCGSTCYGSAVGVPGVDIGATSAWDVSTGGTGNVVGVVDTGIDYTHPDLSSNMWSAPTSFSVTIGGKTITCLAGTHGFNAATNTCDPRDDNEFSHGTHVAGIIGAVGTNGVGVVGVNWRARIMGLKFLGFGGSGTVSNAINAIEFAIQAKARFGASANMRVLSNSWGGLGFSQALLDEINKANASNILFVAAAGNTGTNNDTNPFYPSSYNAPNVIAVAATDNRDRRAAFSSYGATSVDLGAPGVDIFSTTRNNTYGYLSGTSMATPQVSGAAALVLSACGLDVAGLKSDLLKNVDPVASMAGITVTGGRLNANKAIRACRPPAAPTNVKAAPGNAQVTLSWTGSVGATSYTVKRSATSGGPYSIVASGLSATGYTNTGLVNGTTYYYVVSASNVYGQSPNSNEVSATPLASTASDFSLSATPSSQSVRRSYLTAYTVKTTPSGGFSGIITFSVSGVPSGSAALFSPSSVSGGGSSTLVITAGTTTGTFRLTITGKSGTLIRTTQVTLTVTT